jgi:PIN domain nuclease of toxin-antitoxin system
MQVQVLDACAMIALLWGEAGGSTVSSLLTRNSGFCYAHSINFCEVYYQVLRKSDESTARVAIEELRDLGVIERSDIDEPFWQKVASLKSRGRISIADCFEFDALVSLNLCPILFIR